MSPHLKLSAILFSLMIAPPLAALALLEAGHKPDAIVLLALYCALGIAMLPFISRLALYVCVFKDLDQVVVFSGRLRCGGFPSPFNLPVEKEDEHILLTLKRNLNWMLHVLKDREKRLLWRLEETDQARRDFEGLSRTDPLTGLGNRREFDELLLSLSGQKARPATLIRVLLIDCDKFKQVNDVYGHQAGDRVLILLASIIKESVREDLDHSCRLGGDEFAVLLSCREDQAVDVAERIRKRFKEANGLGCTLSMGLSSCHPANGSGDVNWEAVLAKADSALYEAKGAGGDKLSLR
ncbi:MAG: GGDEF domain-containing protein [Desulfovibrio sp.]|nr:GGDEF domain-containing protein [Desulfovibrio sp.]MBI4959751.1 GGDEF domain-containing protein [Desulfovibrio sp.]